jgi:two-component system sensor histidine kinase/response regulator
VLLVEDNDLNQEVATELLREVGLCVDLAPDGAVAVDKVQHNDYDLVLMDMQMPVMDGLTATREIRKLPHRHDLPIVAMTANVMADDRERCLAAGMNDHIAKPIDPHDLIEKLLRWTKSQDRDADDCSAPAAAGSMPDRPPIPLSAHPLWGIAGLDLAAGLRQALGRDGLYHNMLQKFVTGQADTPERLASALGAGDWVEAERVAHTLKGVAAQIGAKELHWLAERLEHAIHKREPETRLAELQSTIADPLKGLIKAITTRLPLSTPTSQATPLVDPEQVTQLIDQLLELLDHDDFASEKLLDENETVLKAALGDRFPRIAEAIHRYDFATALDHLATCPSLATGWEKAT